jgi:hypothetical protein
VSQERREERFAFDVVRRILATTVEPYDIGGRQGAVDAILHQPDGSMAALEVSSIGPNDEARIIHYLGNRGYCKSIAGVTRRWLIEVPRGFHPADMRKFDRLLPWCEARGAEHLSELAGANQEVDDLLNLGMRANVLPNAAGQSDADMSRVFFVLPPMGGFSGRGMTSLPDELAAVLSTPNMQAKIRKLAATGLEERHLLLIVRPSAFSWPVYDGLAFGGPLPSEAPLLPNGLSQIWLLSGIRAGGVVRGISGRRWYRDHPYDEPDDLAV